MADDDTVPLQSAPPEPPKKPDPTLMHLPVDKELRAKLESGALPPDTKSPDGFAYNKQYDVKPPKYLRKIFPKWRTKIEERDTPEAMASFKAEQEALRKSVEDIYKPLLMAYQFLAPVMRDYDDHIRQESAKYLERKTPEKALESILNHDKLKEFVDCAKIGAREKVLGGNAPLENLERIKKEFDYLKFMVATTRAALQGQEIPGNISEKSAWKEVPDDDPENLRDKSEKRKGKEWRKIVTGEGVNARAHLLVKTKQEIEKIREAPARLLALKNTLEEFALRHIDETNMQLPPQLRPNAVKQAFGAALDVVKKEMEPHFTGPFYSEDKKGRRSAAKVKVDDKEVEKAFPNLVAFIHPGSFERREMLKDYAAQQTESKPTR